MLQGLNIDGSVSVSAGLAVHRDRARNGRGPRICVLVGSHWSKVTGGAQYQAQCLVEALVRERRGEVYYVTRSADPGYRPDGYTLVRAGHASGMARGLRRTFHDLRTFGRILREIDPDVIYQRGGGIFTGIAARHARARGCRLVWNIAAHWEVCPQPIRLRRDIAYRLVERRLLEYGIRHASTIVAQHADQARLLEAHYGRTPDALIRNFHPDPLEPLVKRRPCTVMWIANLKQCKQPELFLRLAETLRERTDARFVMVGGMQVQGRAGDALRTAIARSPVEYTGALPQEEVNRLLAEADLLVNTSTAEGFSNTFVQAWMRRVPVVSLNVNPEGVLERHRIGVQSHTFPQLVDDVRALLDDHEARDAMGRRAQQYALAHHSERNIGALMDLLVP
ncbi:glycosyltransferase [Ectothiorhodospiraceae bacterium 2226]|nr:glycosyltransferase [Ectothiorhodospiraceae bacterium 2226]